jgi:hypothetical protein
MFWRQRLNKRSDNESGNYKVKPKPTVFIPPVIPVEVPVASPCVPGILSIISLDFYLVVSSAVSSPISVMFLRKCARRK